MRYVLPTGPGRVGSIIGTLTDMTRPSNLTGSVEGRSLKIKVWYPCAPDAAGQAEMLWADLIKDGNTPLPMRLFARCINTRSTSIPAAAIEIGNNAPLVVYNHGMISFASENTSLMEELASQGCIVLAIQHTEQLVELQRLSKLQSREKRQSDAQLARRIQKESPAVRAELATEFYAAATNTNRIAIERSIDNSFVLDRTAEILAQIPDIDVTRVNVSNVHLLGFSVGGAVATETAKRDTRIATVINLDGGMHGTNTGVPVPLPYLMMYSCANEGINDLLLPGHATLDVSPHTTHLNFHDVAMLLPFLRHTGMLGSTNPRRFIERRNATVREFLLRHPLRSFTPRSPSP